MDLSLSESQRDLKARVSAILDENRSRAAAEAAGAFSRVLWEALGGAGVLSCMTDTGDNGAGGLLDACIVSEELGRGRVRSPYLASAVLSAGAIARWGNDRQKAELLGPLGAGSRILTPATFEPSGDWQSVAPATVLRSEHGALYLDGEKHFVPYARACDALLVSARDERSTPQDGAVSSPATCLVLVDVRAPGVALKPVVTVDDDGYHHARFDGVAVDAAAVVELPPREPVHDERDRNGDETREPSRPLSLIAQWGAVGRCAEMVGGAERVLEICVTFAGRRKQFGKPIGTFQAVQHRCANLAVDVVSSRLVTHEAAWRLSAGLDAAEIVSIAKAWVSDAYRRICAAAHQIHGAVGYTRGHALHAFTRHAHAAGNEFGDAGYHRELLARSLGL